jgi:hypothetical protein
VGDAADHTGRPEGLPAITVRNRTRREAEALERKASTCPSGHELAATLVNRLAERFLLLREQLDLDEVLVSFDGYDVWRQELVDQT